MRRVFRADWCGDGDHPQGGPPPDAERPLAHHRPRSRGPRAGGIHPAHRDAVLEQHAVVKRTAYFGV